MPTVLRINGFRFFFYSSEGNEAAHIHVTKGDAEGKIWLEPEFDVAYVYGFTNSEEKSIEEITLQNFDSFKMKWHEYFNQ